MGLNCVGPLTCGFFSTVPHHPPLVGSPEAEPRIQRPTIKLYVDFQLRGGSVLLTPNCSRVDYIKVLYMLPMFSFIVSEKMPQLYWKAKAMEMLCFYCNLFTEF